MIHSALAGVSIAQLALIVAVGMLTSVLGGVTGYGTGALMPLVLVVVAAIPTCILGTWAYTLLTDRAPCW